MQEQADLIQLLHDHKWKEQYLPRAGGFLEQDARWVDAMNVIDAALAELTAEKAQDAEDRAALQARLSEVRRAHAAARR